MQPNCIDIDGHAIAPGTGFCHRCGLIVTKPKPKRKPRSRKPRREGTVWPDLPSTIRMLIKRYGFDLVESVLYENRPYDD